MVALEVVDNGAGIDETALPDSFDRFYRADQSRSRETDGTGTWACDLQIDCASFDRKTFATVATVPAGTNPDGMLFEPVTKTVWAFNGRSKNATVIDVGSRTVVATIERPGKPEFPPQADGNGHVFVNIEDKNSIVALDAKSSANTSL